MESKYIRHVLLGYCRPHLVELRGGQGSKISFVERDGPNSRNKLATITYKHSRTHPPTRVGTGVFVYDFKIFDERNNGELSSATTASDTGLRRTNRSRESAHLHTLIYPIPPNFNFLGSIVNMIRIVYPMLLVQNSMRQKN